MKIMPSLMAADQLFLGDTITLLDPHVDGYHLDLMDGHFVPQINGGALWVEAIIRVTQRPVMVHLMVADPLGIASQLTLRPGRDTVAFHIETKIDTQNMINFLKKNKIKACVAINPKTAVEELFPFLHMLDQVLVMAVNPGKSGQDFIPAVLDKVVRLVAERQSKELNFTIALDGGVQQKNIAVIAQHGVDEVAAGSALFSVHQDMLGALKDLQGRANRHAAL